MKVRLATVAVALLFFASSVYAADEMIPKTPKEKISYIIGVQLGNDMKRESIELDPAFVAKGLQDLLLGNELLIGDKEAKDFVAAYQKEKAARLAEERKKLGEKNREEGVAFLAKNKEKEGVKTLPSGLQYKVLKEGAGRAPKATDTVVTQFKGTFINGAEFDSSYRRNEPMTLRVNAIIPGWTEALQLMKEGSKWQLFVPPELAYGEQGAGPVGPNATLIFEVELVAVK
ncbi:MAG TPA: FKBP-type peptidyl-prolyl cis-trans isomerase [Syntrophorhabdales bacterium]|nr:FKBP-type peptidyl-prolyl cis-trans isomerase [Syntrophorhabdales bacterium]